LSHDRELVVHSFEVLMRSKKSDHQNSFHVLNQRNQPKIVGFDIEKQEIV